jgi:hypothetical protein
MKMRFLCLLSLAMAVCLAPALQAQNEERQRGGRGRGGPGFGRGGPRMNGAVELLALLRDEKVRKEVEMEDATWEAIQGQMPRPGQGGSREEMAEAFQKFSDGAQDLLDEVLAPERQERLMGLLIQQRGYMAATNEVIAKKIELDEAGIEKVEEAAGEARREMFQGFRGGRGGDDQGDDAGGRGQGGRGRGPGGPGGGFDPERMREMMSQMREKTDEAIAKVLPKEAVAKLDAMKGEKFEFSEDAGFGGFGRRPGGFGGPPGGGRGPGRRPGGGRPGGGN